MEKEKRFKYIYGPVPSWRLGSSLGIDLLSQKEKVCNFDCLYCQIGKTKRYTQARKVYVSTEAVAREIKSLPEVSIDYLTFSGRGEPTLAANLGEVARAIKSIRTEPLAILTNSSLIDNQDVRKDLLLIDFVCLKLDSYSQQSLEKINNPAAGIRFENILNGIKQFRKEYKGRLGLQIMFIEQNKNMAEELAGLARLIGPDEVQINTPLRSCAPVALAPKEISSIKRCFKGLNIVSPYDVSPRKVSPISARDTLKRRGKK